MVNRQAGETPWAELRSWREDRGWTQRELAAALSMTDQAISNIECGRTLPSLVTAFAIEELTGVTARSWALATLDRQRAA